MQNPIFPPRHRFSPFSLLMGACSMLAPVVAYAQYASPADYLDAMDRDGDGRVSLAEYQYHLSDTFRAMDINHNEIIDLSEFDPAVVGPNTQPINLDQYRARLATVFRMQDVDHSSYLDARELGLPPQ